MGYMEIIKYIEHIGDYENTGAKDNSDNEGKNNSNKL